jgi:DHA1 family multidrug resistance protein-like MFS transporter
VAAGIADVALSAMLIFEPIYLYQFVGLSISQILLFFAAIYAWYALFAPLGGKVTAWLGYKHAIITSIFFQLAYWTALFYVKDFPLLLWLAPLLYALQKSLYWPAFHSIVARFANRGQVGRETSALTAIIQGAQIIGPLLGGIIAHVSGSQFLLVVAGVIHAFAIIPLILHKEQYQEREYHFRSTWRLYRTQLKKSIGYWGFGEELLALTVWPIFIFIIVQGYRSAGVVITIASALSVIVSLYVGKLIDGHAKLPILKFGAFLTAIAWFAKPLFPTASGGLVMDTSARVAKNIYFIPLSTVTYERAENGSILPYMVFLEQSLAIGKLFTALVAAALFALVPSFPLLFILAGLISLLFMFL